MRQPLRRWEAGQLMRWSIWKPTLFRQLPLSRTLQFSIPSATVSARIIRRWASKKAKKSASKKGASKKGASKQGASERSRSGPQPIFDFDNMRFESSALEKGWYTYWREKGYLRSYVDIFKWNDELVGKKEVVRMLLPPPNVTGQLHIGHALMLSIQDAYARYYRMKGHPVIWRPGTDHAGIATQMIVEHNLGVKDRRGMSREKLLMEIETWTDKCSGTILQQMERIGASTNPSMTYFTLDQNLSDAVGRAFVKLYQDGLIYRDTRMVNWSVKAGTALSDIEVEFQDVGPGGDVDGAQFGILHTFAYSIDGMPEREIEVSTTRPETIFGDTAIGVHPEDERYEDLHYKYAIHPITEVKIPIIPDADLVDPELGTGAVKVTPAHDSKDFEFWKRHSSLAPTKAGSSRAQEGDNKFPINIIQVFGKDGKMLVRHPQVQGKDRLEARQDTILLLKAVGAYRSRSPHHMRLAICSRTGCVIEPMLSPQWFLKSKPLAANVLSLGIGDLWESEDELVIRPHQYEDEWNKWLFQIQDWCLSRQLWWGHRIPAWKLIPSKLASRVEKGNDNDPLGHINERWVVALTREEAVKQLDAHDQKNYVLVQDEDVLDTWFSSALLPLTTAGWTGKPDQQKSDWASNYPLTFIESGKDILFFWLARMAMLCSWLTGKLPFKEILLHPLICDSSGRKMSKSLGNVVDPLAIIDGRSIKKLRSAVEQDSKAELRVLAEQELLAEGAMPTKDKIARRAEWALKRKIKEMTKMFPHDIRESGADSLRLSLIDLSRQQSINFSIGHVDIWRKVTIKFFNSFKYYTQTRKRLEKRFPIYKEDPSCWKICSVSPSYMDILHPHDLSILIKLRTLIEDCHNAFENRKLHRALDVLRKFIVDDFANEYLMYLKIDLDDLANLNKREIPERTRQAFKMLDFCFEIITRLCHPFMPYTTEAMWQRLNTPSDSSIMVHEYPTPDYISVIADRKLERKMALVQQVTSKLQSMNSQHMFPLIMGDIILVVMGSAADRDLIASYEKYIGRLVKMSDRLNIIDTKAAEKLLGPDVFEMEADQGIETWMEDDERKSEAYKEGGIAEINEVDGETVVLFHPALEMDRKTPDKTAAKSEGGVVYGDD